VSSYLTFSPLPEGGIFSVALSVRKKAYAADLSTNQQVPLSARLLPGDFSGGARTFLTQDRYHKRVRHGYIFSEIFA